MPVTVEPGIYIPDEFGSPNAETAAVKGLKEGTAPLKLNKDARIELGISSKLILCLLRHQYRRC